jgi:large subunit ribosomal protein L15
VEGLTSPVVHKDLLGWDRAFRRAQRSRDLPGVQPPPPTIPSLPCHLWLTHTTPPVTMRNSLLASFGRLALQAQAPVASSSRSVVTIAQPKRLARTITASSALPAFQCLTPRAPTASPADSRSYATAAPSSYSIGSLSPAQPKKTMKRVGRGPGSGRGGTATRGHQGQRARAGNGKPTPGFEGGQTPIMRRFPKRGFVNA